MNEYQRNPLQPLGYTSWADYNVFKSHLRMPLLLLVPLFKRGSRLSEIPVILAKLWEDVCIRDWNYMGELSHELLRYRVAGIPAANINGALPGGGAQSMKLYQRMVDAPGRFAEKGLTVVFHSGFETSALQAAANICKSAVEHKVSCYMMDFPTILEEVKTWEDSDVIKKLKSVNLACVYFIGKEYTTDFTKSCFESLLAQRMSDKKSTILCTHLDPKEYKQRYRKDMPGTSVKFEDPKMIQTINELLKELED